MSGLEMRASCECCGGALPADEVGAVVCSLECTFCAGCAEHLGRACPNCAGALMPRPTRVGGVLARHPSSTEQVLGDAPCPGPGYTGRDQADQADQGDLGDRGGIRLGRHPERARSERDDLDALLDDVLAGTLSTVVDGRPWVVPMLFARDGDRVLLHGSTGAGALRQVASGAPAVLCVMSVDGLVVAHSTFDSSANYRSAVITGRLAPLEGEDRTAALGRISERLIPGRTAEVRAMTRREQAATLAMELPLTDGSWLLKVRSGPPSTPEEVTDAWCGVVPLTTVAGPPAPAPWTAAAGAPVPASVSAFVAARS